MSQTTKTKAKEDAEREKQRALEERETAEREADRKGAELAVIERTYSVYLEAACREKAARDRRAAPSAVMSSSRKVMRPASGCKVPVIRLNIEVLPAPFGPRTPSASPSFNA